MEFSQANGPKGSRKRKEDAGRATSDVSPAAAKVSSQTQDIEELPVPLFRRFHLTAKSTAAVCLFLIATTYALVKYIEIEPLSRQLAAAKEALSASETDRNAETSRLAKLQSQYDELTRSLTSPALIFPQNDSSLLGGAFTLEWEFPHPASGFIIELRDISRPEQAPRLVAVARPEVKRQFFDLGRDFSGEFLWRVRPGSFLNGRPVPLGDWSGIHRFVVYPDVAERIKKTGTLLIGTTPTAYDEFIANDGVGGLKGFEVELTESLGTAISVHLRSSTNNIEVKFVEIPWSRLLHAVDIGEVDVAIRSITKSAYREREYRNLHFSAGYLVNHQVIIRRDRRSEFPKSLVGAAVGVKNGTFNERVARHLADQFKWKVNPSFVNYGDLYQALEDGTLDFAVVDSVLGAKFTKSRFTQLGPALDEILKDFYSTELGSEREEYAIAYHTTDENDGFRVFMDEFLSSEAGQKQVRILRQKYGLDE